MLPLLYGAWIDAASAFGYNKTRGSRRSRTGGEGMDQIKTGMEKLNEVFSAEIK